jgi:hypothetical protein
VRRRDADGKRQQQRHRTRKQACLPTQHVLAVSGESWTVMERTPRDQLVSGQKPLHCCIVCRQTQHNLYMGREGIYLTFGRAWTDMDGHGQVFCTTSTSCRRRWQLVLVAEGGDITRYHKRRLTCTAGNVHWSPNFRELPICQLTSGFLTILYSTFA